MDSNNKTINSELRPVAKDILQNGITEDNCINITNLLQSIIECPYGEVMNDVDLCFLIATLFYVPINSPLLNILKNSVLDRFLYYQYLRPEENPEETNNIENNKSDWVVKKEIEVYPNEGYKEIVQYNENIKTGERKELSRQRLGDYLDKDLDEIFAGLLQDDLKTLTEDEL